jgi:ABC-2 type transport system permease protein
MNHLPLIIKREYLTKVRNKSFIIMTILSPIIMITLIAVVAYLAQLNSSNQRSISILDESGFVDSLLTDTESTRYSVLENINLEEAKIVVQNNGDYGLLHISNVKKKDTIAHNNAINLDIEFYSEDAPSLTLITSIESKLEKHMHTINLEKNGVDVDMIEFSKVNISINQENFTGEKTSKVDSIVKLIFGCAAGYLLFMFIIIYGNMIMRSVIEEKTSRIIEIIISSVKPVQLMLGKIIGTSLAGITQFVIWIILGGILSVIVSLIFGIDIMQMQSSQQELMTQAMTNNDVNSQVALALSAVKNLPLLNLVIAFLFFFVGGYLLYSSLYAAIGAAVDNETDTQQFLIPILVPLILAVYIGIFTVIDDPHGTVSTVFSFIPFTSSVVMLMRIPFGVPLWQQLLSFGILISTFMFTVWMAAKIYRVGILMYGKKPSYKELIKWIKY